MQQIEAGRQCGGVRSFASTGRAEECNVHRGLPCQTSGGTCRSGSLSQIIRPFRAERNTDGRTTLSGASTATLGQPMVGVDEPGAAIV
jgi:hypothetical protein